MKTTYVDTDGKMVKCFFVVAKVFSHMTCCLSVHLRLILSITLCVDSLDEQCQRARRRMSVLS